MEVLLSSVFEKLLNSEKCETVEIFDLLKNIGVNQECENDSKEGFECL